MCKNVKHKYIKYRRFSINTEKKCILIFKPAFKMNHYSNGQIVLNGWTSIRVTVGKEGVYGMTEMVDLILTVY